ncbi:uncharacterized protein LOC128963925 [Oppia nitens]|uniref:uncharacterized protein LOC128963925 n=1 Tax=Oppia nitens TaxID=1686743 RepID=UPI0023DADDD2|nr:uncharacterized protein LOC128963925 [Oppia nitens]
MSVQTKSIFSEMLAKLETKLPIISNNNNNDEDNNCAVISQLFGTTIESLDDYFLVRLFSYLSIREKLAIDRVCRRWHTIIRHMVEKQTGLCTTCPTDDDAYCLDAQRDHCVVGGDIRPALKQTNGWMYDLTDSVSIDNLKSIADNCPYVKCLHLSHCIIDANSLRQLVEMFPDFECLHLKTFVLKSTIDDQSNRRFLDEWTEIGKVLAPVIRHLSIDPHYEFRLNESQMKCLLQDMKLIEEFRCGTHFDREVVGNFLSSLPKRCRVFCSLGREMSIDGLSHLAKNQGEVMTHLIYFSVSIRTAESLIKIGQSFQNLVKLRINLSFNETILTSSSPISSLTKLKEFSVDMNTFTDTHIDDGLIWCIKDGLSSLEMLEITRACPSNRAFSAIGACLPQLKKLILRIVEIQCTCDSPSDLTRERTDRYSCATCREASWLSVANYNNLKELQLLSFYHRINAPKTMHQEFTKQLPLFKQLRQLTIFRYDLSQSDLLTQLNHLMTDTELNDIFRLKLKSIPITESLKIKTPKVIITRDSFML